MTGANPVRGRVATCLRLSVALLLAIASLGVPIEAQETPHIVIHELLAANGSVLADEDGDFEDWIELYNPTDTVASLEGYSLTDDETKPAKWVFPAVQIEPKHHLVIWTSGKDRRTPGTWEFDHALILTSESAGFFDGDRASIVVNGQERALNLRGINVVRLNSQGQFVESSAFDTFASAEAADGLVRYIATLSEGEIVILAVKDEASNKLHAQARAALEQLGSKTIGQLSNKDSWTMIAVVGREALAEEYRPSGQGPATGHIASTMILHTNFKLNKSGEFLGLFSSTGTVIDSITFPKQVRDVSYGRRPNQPNQWCFFQQPTPNAPNGSSCSEGIAQAPETSIPSGFYSSSVTTTLASATEDAEIYFTLDGSEPTPQSERYTSPLALSQTTVLRARAFREGQIPSPIGTYTYLIDEPVHLPILSLVTDPANLWDEEIGIYIEGRFPTHPNFLQEGERWERPVSVQFFEPEGTLGFAAEAGLRIHGGYTRYYPKKSFRLHFRDRYDLDHLEYPVFQHDIPGRPKRNNFESLIIRNGGEDGYGSNSRFRDALMHTLWAEEGGLFSSKRSVFVYLNGVPWGIYNLRERIDEDYLRSNFNVEDADLLMEDLIPRMGDTAHWDAMFAFFEESDLRSEEKYQQSQEFIDLKNFTDYQIMEIYGANIDWVANLVAFRPKTSDGKWRWILWDADQAFGLEEFADVTHNTLAWATRDRPRPDLGPPWDPGEEVLWTTLMLRKLLTNEDYRAYFLNRFADLLNTTLETKHVIAVIDRLASIIEPDIPRDLARWQESWGGSVEEWRANVEVLRDFARKRPDIVREQIVSFFGLSGTATLTLETPSGQGAVQVNTITPKSYPWTGVYLQDVPVTLTAEPAPGYRFARWSDPALPQEPTVSIRLPAISSIQAIFEPAIP